MVGVRWSHVLLALSFIDFFLVIGSHKQYGKTPIPLWISMVALFQPCSFSCLFLYISIDYEQSNVVPSTIGPFLTMLRQNVMFPSFCKCLLLPREILPLFAKFFNNNIIIC